MGKEIALLVVYVVALGMAIAGLIVVLVLIITPSMRSNSASHSLAPRVQSTCDVVPCPNVRPTCT
jgi:hypothetical protein